MKDTDWRRQKEEESFMASDRLSGFNSDCESLSAAGNESYPRDLLSTFVLLTQKTHSFTVIMHHSNSRSNCL